MTTNKLTDEQVRETIAALSIVPTSSVNDISFGDIATALAELQERRKVEKDSEPVGTFFEINGLFLQAEENDENDFAVIPLYRHAQQPVVPDDSDPRDAFEAVFPMPKYVQRCGAGYAATSYSARNAHDFVQKWEGWKACRAAMLQAGTLTNEGAKQAWTGIPDIDNAINMLDRIDTLESCDDDRIEVVKTVLRGLAGNSPVIPDRWIPVSERMPEEGQHVIIFCEDTFVLSAQYRDGEFFDVVHDDDEFFETTSRCVTHWISLPEPPQGVNRG